jgi:zeaxanthin glucosyltransferase
LQNRRASIFETIAEACAKLPVQLVVSLGQKTNVSRLHLAGDPLVVPWAPQLALLKKASAFVTHAGLNSALEALSEGVPMIAVPITNDQPGVAARLDRLGAAEVIPPGRVTVRRMRRAIEQVLVDGRHRAAAESCQAELRRIDGPALAANIIERALSHGASARAPSQLFELKEAR